jgi:hypothetical protein
MAARGARLSPEQRRDIEYAFERRGMSGVDVAYSHSLSNQGAISSPPV